MHACIGCAALPNNKILSVYFSLCSSTHNQHRFAFPALKLPSAVQLQYSTPLTTAMSADTAAAVAAACAPMLLHTASQPPVAMLTINADAAATLLPLTALPQHADSLRAASAVTHADEVSTGGVMIVVADAQHDPSHPAWPLRNVLALLAAWVGGCTLRVLCLRGDLRGVDVERCRVLTIHVPDVPGALTLTLLSTRWVCGCWLVCEDVGGWCICAHCEIVVCVFCLCHVLWL